MTPTRVVETVPTLFSMAGGQDAICDWSAYSPLWLDSLQTPVNQIEGLDPYLIDLECV